MRSPSAAKKAAEVTEKRRAASRATGALSFGLECGEDSRGAVRRLHRRTTSSASASLHTYHTSRLLSAIACSHAHPSIIPLPSTHRPPHLLTISTLVALPGVCRALRPLIPCQHLELEDSARERLVVRSSALSPSPLCCHLISLTPHDTITVDLTSERRHCARPRLRASVFQRSTASSEAHMAAASPLLLAWRLRPHPVDPASFVPPGQLTLHRSAATAALSPSLLPSSAGAFSWL